MRLISCGGVEVGGNGLHSFHALHALHARSAASGLFSASRNLYPIKLFVRVLLQATVLFWALSVCAQEDLERSVSLEFLPSKRELTALSSKTLKRMFSLFSQVQEVRVLLEEDGSYLEALCEERATALLARLLQMGAPVNQTQVSCQAPKVSHAVSRAFTPSVLSARGVSTAMAGIGRKEDKASRARKMNAPKSALRYPLKEDPQGLTTSKPQQAALKEREKRVEESMALASDHAHVHTQALGTNLSLPPSGALSEGASLSAGKKALEKMEEKVEENMEDGQGKKEKNVTAMSQDFRRIAKGSLLHLALQALSESQGWTFIWYPNVTWRAIADIDLTLYPTAQSAVMQLVGLLRLEGKPIQLRMSEGNKVMEILSTQVNND